MSICVLMHVFLHAQRQLMATGAAGAHGVPVIQP